MQIENVQSNSVFPLALDKIMTLDAITEIVKGECIYTKGVFDILHYGHLSLFSYLDKLKQGGTLKIVVGVTSDRVVKIKKGDNRPINPEHERTMQIAFLSQVDFVYTHDEVDYINAITVLKPQVYVKGMDTVGQQDNGVILEKNPEFTFLDVSAKLVVYNDNSSISTSDIINRIVAKA
ncbi:MAG TPA: adenylyltransferase/cytidyltransferase family protein [Flavisolibacter sp.]|nr:adenylyltransferase/cytidyltransferase family protein [Flavisolibacter sp.]